MLKNLSRRCSSGILLIALLGAAIAPAAGQVINRVLVVVNDGVITETEYISAMRRTLAELRARRVEIPERRVLEEQVMEQLILDRIQSQMADRLGIEVSPSQVDRTIAEIAGSQQITVDQLLRQAERVGLSEEQYRNEIEKQLRLQRLVDREVRRRILVSESEIDERVAMLARQQTDEKAEYEVAHISLLLGEGADDAERERALERASEILERATGGENFAELAREYSMAPTAENGGYLGWRSADNLPEVFLDAVNDLATGEISDIVETPSGIHIVKLLGKRGGKEELVEQWNVRHILISADTDEELNSARETAERLRERIAQGEDFGELARVHSADNASRLEGGELGWVSPGDTVPAFEEAVRNLPLNDVSDPVETRFGVHLIEVLDRRRQNVGESRLRDQARRALQEEKGREAYEQWLRRIRDEAYVKFRVKPG